MTNTLIVDCSLKAAATDAFLGAIGKLSEYTVIHFRDIDEGYQVEGNIDAVVLSGSAADRKPLLQRHVSSNSQLGKKL